MPASDNARGTGDRTARRARIVTFIVIVVAQPTLAAEIAQGIDSSPEHPLLWWKAAVLGVVEGLTEYLPISSTGHLLVASRLLELPSGQGSSGLEAVNTYVIAIQFGAILAVIGVFRRRFVQMVEGVVGRDPEGRHFVVTLVIAFLPAAALGAALDRRIEDTLFGPWPIVLAWVVGGVLIIVLERTGCIPDRHGLTSGRTRSLTGITYRQAAIIGLAQCVALWPGTSRSLATMVGALLVGIAMPVAVEFSFLLGFATLTAATLFKLFKDGDTLVDQFGILTPLIGAAFAFGAAVLSIRWLVAYLSKHDLTIFAWYRFVVAAITIAMLAGSII